MKGGLVGTLSTAVVAGFAAYLGTYYYQNPQASLGDTYRRLSETLQTTGGNGTLSGGLQSGGKCAIHRLFGDVKVPGMHLACVVRGVQDVVATVYLDGQGRQSSNFSSVAEWGSLIGLLEANLGLDVDARLDKYGQDRSLWDGGDGPQPNSEQPWAMFTPQGFPIASLDDLQFGENEVLIFEGGNFIWPGVRLGHVTEVQGLQGLGSVRMTTVSLQPLVFSVDGFLLDEECDYIKREASPHMRQSGVTLMDHDKGKEATDWRTSSTHFMRSAGHPPLQDINKRVGDLTRKPVENQEHVQVLRYEHTQRYDVHHDYFDPRLYAKDKSTLELTQDGRRNRMATVLWYLSDVSGGGETIFPRSGNLPDAAEKRDCHKMGGIRVPPKQGRVIMFYSMKPNGDLDPLSAHGSCGVKDGVKWAANKWIWNKPISHVI